MSSGFFSTEKDSDILQYRLDPLSLFFTINALLNILLIAIVTNDTSISRVLIIYDGFVFPVGLGIIVMTRPNLEVFSKLQSILKYEKLGQEKTKIEVSILITAVGFLSVQVSQAIILRKINLDIWSGIAYQAGLYGNGGILEEWLFRFAIFGYLDTRHFGPKKIPPIISIIVVSVIFEIYHLAVYGGQPLSLLAVFVSSIIITTVFWRLKRLWAPQLIHLVNNAYIAPTQYIAQAPVMMTFVKTVLISVGVHLA